MIETNCCDNPICTNEGTKKCQSCGSVKYCSSECQKTHWQNHRKICKTIREENNKNKNITNSPIINLGLQEKNSSPSSSSSSKLNKIVDPDIIKRIIDVKQEIQKSFQMQDFASAVKYGESGLLIATELPDLESNIESIQIHVNLCTAYLQLGNKVDAEKHSTESLLKAEIGCRMRPNIQQSYDMLFVALNSNSVFLMNTDKLGDAEKVAIRALALVEDRLQKTDPRLFKALRCLAVIRERLNKIDEAYTLFVRAYELGFKQWGPLQQEVQMCLDDLINILFKKNDVISAKTYAKTHHDALVEKGVVHDDLLMADSAARRALILSRSGESIQADPLMKEALAIREKKLGPESQAVAVTLNALAGISEACGKPDSETEALLNKALEIFKKLPAGSNSVQVRNTINLIGRLRNKQRNGITVEDVSDDEDGVVKVFTSKRGSNKFAENDAGARMRAAGQMFEKKEFSQAEVLLSQAYNIFLKDFGANHENTKAAAQNLEIVRNNGINKLWHEVAQDEITSLSKSFNNLSFDEQTSHDPELPAHLQESSSSSGGCTIF